MDKVYILVEEYHGDGDTLSKITPCATEAKAKELFNAAVAEDISNYPDSVQTKGGSYYSNYESEYFEEAHTIIYYDAFNIVK